MKYFVENNNALTANFEFLDFSQAWAFMNEIAFIAEKQNHHPNWSNVWNTVTITLCTHDAGDIVTEKDFDLAQAIETVFESRYTKR